MSSATEKAKRDRLGQTVQVFAAVTLPGAQGKWTAITCSEFTQRWKALGGDAVPCRHFEMAGKTLRIHDGEAGPVLATVQFVGPERCFHMRHVTGGAS